MPWSGGWIDRIEAEVRERERQRLRERVRERERLREGKIERENIRAERGLRSVPLRSSPRPYSTSLTDSDSKYRQFVSAAGETNSVLPINWE